MTSEGAVVPREEFHAFVVRCMRAVGVPESHACALGDLLVAADYRGHYSHGLNRLEMYLTDVQTKTTACEGTPHIVKETVSTALVDGDNVLGPVVGKFCIDLAIEKAKTSGIGWVSARASNHFGIAGWYGIRCAEQGLLGMAFTNTSPLLVPTRSKQEVLGTNPICCAAPAKDGDSFVLDMATTSVALGKIELADRKDQPIPEGWAVDKDGKTTTDPKQAQGLSPLGGAEKTSGYKGYGLSMMVEVFCGILSGSMYGPHVRRWKDANREANLVSEEGWSKDAFTRGQCFVAIDPGAFADGFEDRMSELMNYCRNIDRGRSLTLHGFATSVDPDLMPQNTASYQGPHCSLFAEGETEVLVAGDPERKHMEKCDNQGGIPYHPNQIKHANEMAARLKVAPMKTL